MKKNTLLFIIGMIFTWQAQAQFPEGFESAVPPAGWLSQEGANGVGVVQSWETTSDAASGSAAAFIRHEDTGGVVSEDWLVTPQFTPTGVTNILEFQQKQFDPDFDFFSTFEIRVSTTSQNVHADFVTIDTQAELDFDNVYSPHYVDLTAYEGSPIYVAFVLIGDDGEDWYIDDVNLVPFANAPDCDVTNVSLADAATDVDIDLGSVTITWDPPATGDAPAGYDIYLGTSPGLLDLFEAEAGTTVTFTGLEYSTTYYWQVTPYNVGGSATGCSEFSFTTEVAPEGSICTNAIIVPSTLPYVTSENTGNFGNDYTSDPGTSCGTNNSYLSGDDVVYSYTPTADGAIALQLSSISDTYAGMFIYEDCADIGSTCAVGVVNENSISNLTIDNFSVISGITYYVVISTWADPQTTSYDLEIVDDTQPVTINSCGDIEGSILVTTDCINSGGFLIEVSLTNMGTTSSIEFSDDQGSATQILNAPGTIFFGPYANMTDVIISLSADGGACTYDHFSLTQETCPLDPDYLNDFTVFPGAQWYTATAEQGFLDESTSGWQVDDFANDDAHINGRSAKVSIYGSTRAEYLVTPAFNLSSGPFYLNFDIALTDFVNTNSAGTMGVDDFVSLNVTTDNWDTNTELIRWDSNSTISPTGEAMPEMILNGYTAETKFALLAFSDTSNSDNEFFIDNFQITAASLSVADNVIDGFSLYPNPTRGTLNFKAQDAIETIRIYNLLGQEVFRVQPRVLNTQVDMIDLPTGIYVVKVQVGDQIGSYKIIKQ